MKDEANILWMIKANKTEKSFILWFVLSVTALSPLVAQPIPINDIKQDQYRILQLMQGVDSGSSITNLPLLLSSYKKIIPGQSDSGSMWYKSLDSQSYQLTKKIRAGIYHPTISTTYNSRLPHGENNGTAWYGTGFNSEFQTGFWLTSDYITLSFQPNISHSQNSQFTKPGFIPGNRFRGEIGNIDRPYRFGTDSYYTADPGQTSLRFHYSGMEAGISTETLWWGPAVRYPLMMSNNAPGMKHLFLGTRTPLSLPLNIGNVNFRWIWAKPEDSRYFDQAEAGQDRFFNGINFAYSPSFIPHMAFGFTRGYHQYIPENGLSFTDFTGIIIPRNIRDDLKNHLASVYFRWVFPESHAEIYGEYFREDTNWDFRDFLMQPDNDRAYSLGIQKIIQSDWIDFFKINVELTSLVPNRVDEVRPQIHYYIHTGITQGHTNKGQVLGAAIGPGSGSQYLAIDGYFNTGQLGLFLQRVENNDFFHYEFYDNTILNSGYSDIWRNWIEMNVGLRGRYMAGPVLLSGKLSMNQHLNYGRFGYGDLDVDFETFQGRDITNWQFQISAQYFIQ